MDEKSFYLKLIHLSKALGKSINQIERELGYPRNALHNYKYGGEPSGERLVELAQYFGVTPEYLLGKDKESEGVSPTILFTKLSEEQKMQMLLLCQKWIFSKIKL
jgi:transcriptional regulator with XRE-family HTH domain